MYDYRQSRQTTRKTKRPVLRTKTSQRRERPPFSLTAVMKAIGRGIAYAVVAVLIMLVGLFFLAKIMLPMVFPLERDTTVVFVPPVDQSAEQIGVVTFKPSNVSITGVIVSLSNWPTPVPDGEEYTSAAAWSRTVQLVVDEVLVTPAVSDVTQSRRVENTLWQEMNQKPVQNWLRLVPLRLWVFSRTVPLSQQRWLEVDTPAQWDRTKFQLQLGSQFTQCQVGVINTTQERGLATRMSSFIEESGYPVVRLTDNRDNLVTSIIYVDPSLSECQAEAARLSQLLPQPTIEANADVVHQHRAQIVIFLGQDVVNLTTE